MTVTTAPRSARFVASEHLCVEPRCLRTPVAVILEDGRFTGQAFCSVPDTPRAGDVGLGTLHVPDGAVAWLIHTDEHGVNGIGPGTYRLHGKIEQAEEIRRVAD